MNRNLFQYILKYSKKQQLTLIAIIICAFPFYYLSLDLPKTIINDAINGSQFPVELGAGFFGYQFSIGQFEQLSYLLLLCMAFLLLVVINGGFKYFINVYRGILGERMLRRLRFQLIERIMKFPLARFRKTSQGELVSMVNQETEPLAGFIGECFSLPLYQGGMMLTILVFMFIQDWKLGIAAIALYPLQTWLIPKLQRKVNLLNQERIIHMRKLAENLGETVAGINEIKVNNSTGYLNSIFSEQLGGIFGIRVQIFRQKFFIKFLNSFIGQITPFMFFLLGGMLVIRGDLSFGALVAVLAAYKDLSPPWKELLAWYQLQADARMKFTLLVDQFTDSDPGQSDNTIRTTETTSIIANPSSIKTESVSVVQGDGSTELSGISLLFKPGEWVRIVGSGSSGKNTLAHVLANLVNPTSGKIRFGTLDYSQLTSTEAGRYFGYVGHDSYLFSRSIQENIVFSLKDTPSTENDDFKSEDSEAKYRHWLEEAKLSGNSEVRSDIDWIDYQRAGVKDASSLLVRIGTILKYVNLEDELVKLALNKSIDERTYPSLAKGILEARKVFKSRATDDEISQLVESLDPNEFNDNASIAENLLFGSAIDSEFSVGNLASNTLIQELLQKHGLDTVFRTAALSIATTMVEILSTLPPEHEFFSRYNLVDASEVDTLKRIINQIDHEEKIDTLKDDDKRLLSSLPYRLIGGRHRLGVFDAEHKAKIVAVRRELLDSSISELGNKIRFYDPKKYNDQNSIGDNVIFGRIAFNRRGAEDIVYREVLAVLQSLDLMPVLLEVGLSAPSGLAGSLLPTSRRQKIVLARALLKQPHVLIINEGLNALDSDDVHQVLKNIKTEFENMTVFWFDGQERFDNIFDRSVIIDSGKISRDEALNLVEDKSNAPNAKELATKSRTAASVFMNEKIELIRQIPIFRSLDLPMIRIIAKTSVAVDIPAGERLFNQGDIGDSLYVIVEGEVDVLMRYGNTEVSVSKRGENEVIGELAILSNQRRSASAKAETDLVTLRLDRTDFIDIMQTHGDVGYQLLQVVTSELINVNKRTNAASWSISTSESTENTTS
ncbi:MAG: cyclic nucleotide-binding domain-containing protein [Granulosicoccus sp.]|nr:cyclic nucleotide-binding domain-containing protein [Granulosicoccus sp.]